MKKKYETPLLEAFALSGKESVLTISNGLLTIMATTPPDNGIETLSGWGDLEETWE